MFYWSESFTSLIRFWQPQFDGLTRLTLTPLDFTTDLRHWADVHRTTLNASSCITISGGRIEQLDIIADFLPRHWLYEWFSQFHSCGTYSVLSRSPSNVCCSKFKSC